MLLRRGMIGADVASLVHDLIEVGFLPSGGQGNNFNLDVERAVKSFQSSALGPDGEPLVVDGKVGPLTRFALDVALGKVEDIEIRNKPLHLSGSRPHFGSEAGWNALQIAERELNAGAGETLGDNAGPDIDRYRAITGAESGDSWCASFVSYCFAEGNPGHMPFAPSAGARKIFKTFRDKGWTYNADFQSPPESGDMIVWWRGVRSGWKGHIGFVASYRDGIVTTIEGNRGSFPSKVRSFTYVLGRIDKLLGFGRAVP